VLDEPDPLRRGPGNDVTAAWVSPKVAR
jgi:hypothetical protein